MITGEGRLDGQTVMGKAPIGVAKIAKKYEKPVLAFSGCVAKEAVACNAEGIDAFSRFCGTWYPWMRLCIPTMP